MFAIMQAWSNLDSMIVWKSERELFTFCDECYKVNYTWHKMFRRNVANELDILKDGSFKYVSDLACVREQLIIRAMCVFGELVV